MYPILLWLVYTGLSFVIGQTENFTARVMIAGDLEAGGALVQKIEAADRVTVTTVETPLDAIRDGQLDLLVELARREGGYADDFEVRFTGDSSKDRSRIATSRVEDLVTRHRTAYLEAAGGTGDCPARITR